MAEVSEIEAGGEIRTIKDTTARQGVAANADAIDEINKMIPSNASASNQMATQADLNQDTTSEITVQGGLRGEATVSGPATFFPIYKNAKKGTLWGTLTLPYSGSGGISGGGITIPNVKAVRGHQLTVGQIGNTNSTLMYARSFSDFYINNLIPSQGITVSFSAFVEFN